MRSIAGVAFCIAFLGCGGGSSSPDDPDAAVGNCEPVSCESVGGCGIYMDGCGGMITCSHGCTCSDENFSEACPSMPCATASGCKAGRCVYEPVVCGGQACVCNAGDCSPEDLRSCGESVCTTNMCEPGPSAAEGAIAFANTCIEYAPRSCGTCDLGRETCDADADAFVCDDINASHDPSLAECNSESLLSTFVFLDTSYAGGDSNGSRPRPFVTLADAVNAAQARNASGVIIAGSPTFSEPLIITDGVSIHGGYGAAPDFAADPAQRPTWEVPESFRYADSAVDTTKLIGMEAFNVQQATVVEHVNIRTADLVLTSNFGPNNYGVHVENSPSLRLIDVDVQAGRGGPALAGASGENGPSNGSIHGAVSFVPSGGACAAQLDPGRAGGVGPVCFDGSQHRGGTGGVGVRFVALGSGGTSGSGPGGAPGGTGAGNTFATAGSGGNGATGASGANGASSTPSGTIVGGFWRGSDDSARGGIGASGAAGGGGGGGRCHDGGGGICHFGAPGAGGGAGGCGGAGGYPATPAGSSFAIMVVDSQGMEIVGGSYRAGGGGPGAAGGPGGVGAGGGQGGSSPTNPQFENATRRGGVGGAGGTGGRGGAGGNSAGGSSVGIYCHDTTIDLSAASYTAGTGGAGGERAGTTTAPQGESHTSVGCE